MPEEQLRRVNVQNSAELIEVRDINDQFVTQVCLTYLRSTLDGDAAHRANPDFGGEGYVELIAEGREEELKLLRSMLGAGDVALVRPML